MQLFSLLHHFPRAEAVHLFDINPQAAERLKKELEAHIHQADVHMAGSAEEAVRRGEVVVTCTVADRPYIPYDWLQKGAFVSNVSIMDVHKEVFLKADKVVVDDWDQCNREKKVIHQLVLEGRFSREQLHAELGEIVVGRKPGRESPEEIILLNPMGMAVEDIACAQDLYRKALEAKVGTWLDLY
jgi:ornithine cyclodeaminase